MSIDEALFLYVHPPLLDIPSNIDVNIHSTTEKLLLKRWNTMNVQKSHSEAFIREISVMIRLLRKDNSSHVHWSGCEYTFTLSDVILLTVMKHFQ